MKKKIIASFMITSGLIVFLFILAFSEMTHHDLYQSEQNKIISQANAVEIEDKLPVDLLVNRKLEDYSDVILQAFARKNVKVSVWNRDGKIIQSSDGFFEEKTDVTAKNMIKSTKQSNVQIQSNGKEKHILVYWKLTYKGQQIAILRFEKSLDKIERIFWNAVRKAIVVGIIIFFISSILSFVFAKRIVRPFEEIIAYVKEMTEGEYKKKLHGTYNDEAGKIVETLNFMGEEIQRKNKERYDFISSISHELKTPLTAIYGWTETLFEQTDLTEEEKKIGIDVIRQESQRLSQLVDNLLYFSKNEAERSKIMLQKIDIEIFAKSVISFMKIRSDKKQIDILFHTKEAYMYADEGKMRQVFVNLIENAVKFSPPHTKVEISASSNHSNLLIKFKDHGIGIEKEELKNITEAFYQISSVSQGEGLGLAVCSNIIALHGGSFNIESEPGKGTCIQIELPQ